jgi:hypothetical protein
VILNFGKQITVFILWFAFFCSCSLICLSNYLPLLDPISCMGRLVYLMRKCHLWIQPHPHGVILRHLLNMVKSFLCFSTNYFENRLLPNNLIIVRNHRDYEEDKRDIKKVLEVQGNTQYSGGPIQFRV